MEESAAEFDRYADETSITGELQNAAQEDHSESKRYTPHLDTVNMKSYKKVFITIFGFKI